MVNKNLIKSLVEIGKEWSTRERDYSYETRFCGPLSENQYPEGGLIAIIEVQGFFRDKQLKNPIKLHYEKVFSVPDLFNMDITKEQIDICASSFSILLEEFTINAYKSFQSILAQQKSDFGNCYTTDPIYW